jgi:hypothetical protein
LSKARRRCPIRFPDKNCIDAIFICRRRPKCAFALPVEMFGISAMVSGRAFKFQLKINALFNLELE